MTSKQVEQNAQSYYQQVAPLLDADFTEVRYNSEWMTAMSAQDLLALSMQSTVARMLERDDFSQRYKAQQAIAISEFLYPLMQAYDSVVLKADLELGGHWPKV